MEASEIRKCNDKGFRDRMNEFLNREKIVCGIRDLRFNDYKKDIKIQNYFILKFQIGGETRLRNY